MNRRGFISAGVALTSSLVSRSFSMYSGTKIDSDSSSSNTEEKLRILILGGTNYIGPEIVKMLKERGHRLTLFNRGQTNPELFPEIENLIGNRYPHLEKGLKELQNERQWDVVIDTWQECPLCVRDTAELLKDRCKQYIYISTIAVYGLKNFQTKPSITETTKIPKEKIPLAYNEASPYTKRKRTAEQIAQTILKEKLCVLRPHSICGEKLDATSDNQRYWPIRLQRGGKIACPGDGFDTTQYIDVLDLARFTLRVIDNHYSGIFNVFTTENMLSYLYGLKALSNKSAELIFIDHKKLEKHGISSFSDMPMWAPRQKIPGFFTISNQKALEYGLEISPLAESFQRVISGFYAIEDSGYKFGMPKSNAGLSSDIEIKLIQSVSKGD